MNKRAEIFKAYLEEKEDISVFTIEEAEDEVNTVLFRTSLGVKGNNLPFVVTMDDGPVVMLRAFLQFMLVNVNNRSEVMELVNRYNVNTKLFKYSVVEDGSLVVDCYICDEPEKMDVEKFNIMVSLMLQYLFSVREALWEDIKKIVGEVKPEAEMENSVLEN